MTQGFTSVVLAPGLGGAGTVTLTGLNIPIAQIISVTDVTQSVPLYIRGNPAYDYTAYTAGTNSVLTLNNSTVGLSSGDSLICYYDDLIAVGADITAITGSTATTATNTGTTAANTTTIVTNQGTSATGITQPTGGAGILGWLSGIFNKLNTSIAITVASLPLPSGASTSALQTTGNTSLSTIATNTTSIATSALQTTGNTSLATIATNSGTQATAANQTTGNTSLSTIATAQGNSGTGITIPTGGLGILGWLSGIYNAVKPSTLAINALTPLTVSGLTVSNIKTSAGNLYTICVTNPNASVIYIQFYNTTGTPTLGTSVVWSLPIAASSTVTISSGSALALANFTTGIGVGAATTATGSTAPGSAPSITAFFN